MTQPETKPLLFFRRLKTLKKGRQGGKFSCHLSGTFTNRAEEPLEGVSTDRLWVFVSQRRKWHRGEKGLWEKMVSFSDGKAAGPRTERGKRDLC